MNQETVQRMMLAYLVSKQSTHLSSRPLLIEMKREIEDAITLGGTIMLPEIKTVGLGKPTPGITLETDDPLLVFLYEVARDHLDLQTMLEIAERDRSHEATNTNVRWRLSHAELADKVNILAELLRRRVVVPERKEVAK